MNTQKGFISIGILLAIILGVVIVGGGAYYVGHQSAFPQWPVYQDQTNTQPVTLATTPTPAQSTSASETVSVSGTLAQVLSHKGSYSCTLKSDNPKGPYQGTAYIAGGQIRVDVSAEREGQKITESEIQTTGGYIYIWSNKGAATKLSNVGPSGPATLISLNFSSDSSTQYKCNSWIADESVFVPPANIHFYDSILRK